MRLPLAKLIVLHANCDRSGRKGDGIGQQKAAKICLQAGMTVDKDWLDLLFQVENDLQDIQICQQNLPRSEQQ